jgi:hypothetical protein
MAWNRGILRDSLNWKSDLLVLQGAQNELEAMLSCTRLMRKKMQMCATRMWVSSCVLMCRVVGVEHFSGFSQVPPNQHLIISLPPMTIAIFRFTHVGC